MLFSIIAPIILIYINKKTLSENRDFMHSISYSVFFSSLAFLVTIKMIPAFMEMNHLKKIFGIDINKVQDIKDLQDPGRKEM